MRCREAGITLIELMVAIVVFGAIASVATLAIRPGHGSPAGNDAIRECQRHAIEGRVEILLPTNSGQVRCLPDGRVLGLGADQLVGHARRGR